MRCLFIGGPLAGKVLDVRPDIKFVEHPVALDNGWGAIRYYVRHLEDDNGDTYPIGITADELTPVATLMKSYELHAKGESQ